MNVNENLNLSYKLIVRLRWEQLTRYELLKNRFAGQYERIRHGDSSRFVTPWWSQIVVELENAFLPYPQRNFLRHGLISYTMGSSFEDRALAEYLATLETVVQSDQLMAALCEDPVGEPVLHVPKYHTSCNAMRHLYDLSRFAAVTEANLNALQTVVEWGGGYGNLAKIMRRVLGRPLTYVIVDLPIMSALQWLYLACVFGEENVHLVASPDDPIRPGCFNLLPTPLLDAHEPRAELFVSTFALSESSAEAQDCVVERGWFGAERLLISYCDTNETMPNSSRLGDLARKDGAAIHPFGSTTDKTALWYALR